MEFGIEICDILIMRSSKRQMTEGIELPNQKILNARRNGNLQILGNIGSRHHQTNGNEGKNSKGVSQKKRLETKLYSKNPITRINAWAVLIKYSGTFLKWTQEELKQMDQRTRKLMTMHKALHPRDDVDRLYVSRKEEGELPSIEDSVDASIQKLKANMKNAEED